MSAPAACQCIACLRYLVRNRVPDGPQTCAACQPGGIPLTPIRGTPDPLTVELLALLAEECGEVTQRAGKILRWGWAADYDNTTQRDKLETELGDLLVVLALLLHNERVTVRGIVDAYTAKLDKLREDAAGPRQRLLTAQLPVAAAWMFDALRNMYHARVLRFL